MLNVAGKIMDLNLFVFWLRYVLFLFLLLFQFLFQLAAPLTGRFRNFPVDTQIGGNVVLVYFK